MFPWAGMLTRNRPSSSPSISSRSLELERQYNKRIMMINYLNASDHICIQHQKLTCYVYI